MSPDLAAAVVAVAESQHGVVGRRQLYRLGVTRWQLEAQLRARRWRLHGRQTIAIHNGTLGAWALRWHAVIEAGPRSALDGHSALEAAGLTGWVSDHVRVSVPRGAPVIACPGVVVRQTRRLRQEDVVPAGVSRVRPETAAVRAALWAYSNRQAATILAMAVQQRVTTADAIARALLDVRRHRRLRFLHAVVHDLLDGAHSLGELDFARICRRRGLPSPDRQRLRRVSSGRAYLDAEWVAYGLVVEIDGVQHAAIPAQVPDALRQNDIALDGTTVLRIPVLGLRTTEDQFMDQVRQGLVDGGWRPLRHDD